MIFSHRFRPVCDCGTHNADLLCGYRTENMPRTCFKSPEEHVNAWFVGLVVLVAVLVAVARYAEITIIDPYIAQL